MARGAQGALVAFRSSSMLALIEAVAAAVGLGGEASGSSPWGPRDDPASRAVADSRSCLLACRTMKRRWAGSVLSILSLLVLGCKRPKPLPEAILGTWEVWCYTTEDTSSCLSKEKLRLLKTFQPGGVLDVRLADGAPSSDRTSWSLEGDELTVTVSGGGLKLVESWRARVDDDRLVLWDPGGRRGVVLGRVGAGFEPGESPVSRGGPQTITLKGQSFTIDLPEAYRQTRSDEHRQHWGPASGDGFEVRLSMTPRAQREENGKFVTAPCTSHDYGGVSGVSQEVNGVQRETSIGTSLCLEGTEFALHCSTEHTRGYLETSEKDAALALCRTIRR